MVVGLGWKGKLGIQWSSVNWGSYSAPAANDEMDVDSANFRATVNQMRNVAFNEFPIEHPPLPGAVALEGEFSGTYRYEGLERLVQAAMGSTTTWTSRNAAITTNYSGDFMLLDTSGASPALTEQWGSNFLSVAVDQSGGLGSYWELFGGMAVQRLEFTWRQGDYLRYSTRLVGGAVDGAPNATNKPYQVDQAAPGSLSKLANHVSKIAIAQHANTDQDSADAALTAGFWLTNYDTTAMANGDRVKISDWSFLIDNTLGEPRDFMSDPFLQQPWRDSVRISGSLTMPYIEVNASFIDAIELRSDYMEAVNDIDADDLREIQYQKMVATLHYTDGTNDWAITFIIPCCVLTAITDINLARKGMIPATFAWEAFAHTTGLTPTQNFRASDTYFYTGLTAAQKVPWINIQNVQTVLL